MSGHFSPRWLFVGEFSGRASGQRMSLAGESFRKILGLMAPELQVGPTASAPLRPVRPRDLSPTWIEANLEAVQSLRSIASGLRRGSISVAAAVEQLQRANPPLVEFMDSGAPIEKTATPPSPSRDDEASSSEAEDGDIFDRVALPGSSDRPNEANSKASSGASLASKRAVDAFVAGLGLQTNRRIDVQASAISLAEQLEERANDEVMAVWNRNENRQLIANWKGIRMVVGEISSRNAVTPELLDLPRWAPGELVKKLSIPGFASPDMVVICDPVASLEILEDIRQTAVALEIPCVVSLASQLANDERAIAFDSPWVAIVENELVFGEPEDFHGDARAILRAPGVFAVAGRLTASFSAVAGFARATDLDLVLQGPASVHCEQIGASSAVSGEQTLEDLAGARDRGRIRVGTGRNLTQIWISNLCVGTQENLDTQILRGRLRRLAREALVEFRAQGLAKEALGTKLRTFLGRSLHPPLESFPEVSGDSQQWTIVVELVPPWALHWQKIEETISVR